MLKKFILIIFVLFLAVPTAFADDTTIIPVMWLFSDFKFNKLYEIKSPTASPNFNNDILRTFSKSGNTVYELKSPTASPNFNNDILRTFFYKS